MPGSLMPSLVEDLALLGSWMPFGQAAKTVGHFRKIEVSEATVRRFTERSGQAWVELQTEQAAVLEGETGEGPEGPALQQLSVDGAMVPLLHGEWCEVKTLAIGTVEKSSPEGEVQARELSYFSRAADHQSFGRLAMVETHRRGTEGAAKVCAVVDGAEWQQSFIDLHRSDAVRILDWCHAAEHLAKAGQAAYGAGSAEASEWLGIQLRQLKHGEPEEVLRNLRALWRDMGEGRETDGGVTKVVKGSLEYLEKRREQIRYSEFQANGYPIGSGAVESANKLLVEARLKGSGMHWAREHVNPMVALRTVLCSDRWGEVWPQISQRLRGKARKQAVGRHAKPSPQGESTVAKETCRANTRPVARNKAVLTPQSLGESHEQNRKSSPTTERRPAVNHPWRRMTIGRKPLPSNIPKQPSAKI